MLASSVRVRNLARLRSRIFARSRIRVMISAMAKVSDNGAGPALGFR